jgi:ribonuclease BN (tRNA processing enzyme)
MELTVLGAGPAYTDRIGSTGAAYLVREGDTAVLLDLGQGSFPRLTAALEPSTLDAVFVSHLHPDHFIDLVPLRHYLRYHFDEGRRLRVFAPRGLDDRLDALHGQPGFVAQALDVITLGEGRIAVGGLGVEARLVTHTDESYGFRVAVAAAGDSAGLVYSGDCGRAADLVPLIHPGDVLLIEVSFGSGPVPPGALHLNAEAVGEVAAATRAGRILLTHLQMGHDEATTVAAVKARFDGPVELMEPGSRLTI